MGKKKRRGARAAESPPEGCAHYHDLGDMPWDCQKYFEQRYDIFSLYDHGVWMTEDSWFGVTAEPVAREIAQQLASSAPSGKTTLIDAFAGVGGNSIAFALSGCWQKIIAIEKDPVTLACAKHNAAVYGVDHMITWYEGDCFELLLRGELAGLGDECVVFGSPPWGGPGYTVDSVFDLSKMQPYDLRSMIDSFRSITSEIVLFLPRTSDVRQLAAVRQQDKGKVNVVHYCLRGASKEGIPEGTLHLPLARSRIYFHSIYLPGLIHRNVAIAQNAVTRILDALNGLIPGTSAGISTPSILFALSNLAGTSCTLKPGTKLMAMSVPQEYKYQRRACLVWFVRQLNYASVARQRVVRQQS